ncbi:MAG TPA: hypothetical protein VLA21_03325 [Candidatus Limnocylindria bacterium]|nr:hypothetical protein [Candidatus Limnocylindria bacterium]
MKKPHAREDLFAVQYAGGAAMLDVIQEMLSGMGAPFERAKDGRAIYTLLRLDMGDTLRREVRQASLRRPGQTLHIRWCMLADLDECPDHAYVRDGAFVYPEAQEVSITWTGPWLEMGTREAINAVLEDAVDRLGRIQGMESATVVLHLGESQARATAAGGVPGAPGQAEDMTRGLNNEHFARMLAALEE